jgi:hypothetical protein
VLATPSSLRSLAMLHASNSAPIVVHNAMNVQG